MELKVILKKKSKLVTRRNIIIKSFFKSGFLNNNQQLMSKIISYLRFCYYLNTNIIKLKYTKYNKQDVIILFENFVFNWVEFYLFFIEHLKLQIIQYHQSFFTYRFFVN